MEKLFTEEMIMWIPVCCLSSIILNFIAVKFFRNTFCDRIDMSAEKESEYISLQSHDDMYELYINGVMEIFLSITCILGVCFFYDSVVSDGYTGLKLLSLTIVAVITMNFIDWYWLDRRWRRNSSYSKQMLRLFSNFYLLIIVFCLYLYLGTEEYNQLLILLLTFTLGRFIYFDNSLNLFKEIPHPSHFIHVITDRLKPLYKYIPCITVTTLQLIVMNVIAVGWGIYSETNVTETLFVSYVAYLMGMELLFRMRDDFLLV